MLKAFLYVENLLRLLFYFRQSHSGYQKMFTFIALKNLEEN